MRGEGKRFNLWLAVVQLAISEHVSPVPDLEHVARVRPRRLKVSHPDPQVLFMGPLRLALDPADGHLEKGLGRETVPAHFQRRLHHGVHSDARHPLQVTGHAHAAELVSVEEGVEDLRGADPLGGFQVDQVVPGVVALHAEEEVADLPSVRVHLSGQRSEHFRHGGVLRVFFRRSRFFCSGGNDAVQYSFSFCL